LAELLVEGPFTAATFHKDSSALALEDKFQIFLSPERFKITSTPAGLSAITIPAYRAYLNHQAGPYWINGSTTRVGDLYKTRIEAFIQALRTRRNVLVYTHRSPANLKRLIRAIDALTPSARYRLLILNYFDTKRFESECDDPRVRIVHTPMPREDYIWHQAADYNTAEGLAFEQPIAEAIAEELQKLASA
jgi:hypothetical protein